MPHKNTKREYTDADLIEALEARQGVNLISDDNGHWAVSGAGVQPIVDPDEGDTFTTTVDIISFVEPHEWKPTIREAIIYYLEEGS